MVGPDPRTCPPPAILGAYIEGKVDAPTRKAVQRHVAACPECVFVIGEASRYLANEDGEPEEELEEPPRIRWWSAAIAAAVGLMCVVAAAGLLARARDPLNGLRRAAATAAVRPVEGQLDGFSHAPYRSSRSDMRIADARVRLEAERVAGIKPRDARAWHARGIAALVLRRNSDAVAMLNKAVWLAPHEAEYWSDLAAAHLAASQEGNAAELRAAVNAAERATALAPSLPAAHFNRALALQHLGAHAAAARAYDKYLKLDPDSPWSTEARLRRALLPS